jgi:hypothetical protein
METEKETHTMRFRRETEARTREKLLDQIRAPGTARVRHRADAMNEARQRATQNANGNSSGPLWTQVEDPRRLLGANIGPGSRGAKSETREPTSVRSRLRRIPFVEMADKIWSVLEMRGRLQRGMIVSDPTNEIFQGSTAA